MTTLYPNKPCSECGNPSLARNLCPTHYSYWRRSQKLYTVTCAHCGETKKVGNKGQEFCSAICNRRHQLSIARPLAMALLKKNTDVVPWVRPRTWAGSSSTGRLWTSGTCGECGRQFVGQGRARWCSARCGKANKLRLRILRNGEFSVTTIQRHAIYARDNNICQLCSAPVDMTLHYNDRMSATLDHIEPQSLASTPDHSALNLRLAHRLCNSTRGNGVGGMTPSPLAAPLGG